MQAFDDAVRTHETAQGHTVTQETPDTTYKEFLKQLESLEETQTEAAKDAERRFYEARYTQQQRVQPEQDEEAGDTMENEYDVGDYLYHKGEYVDPPKRRSDVPQRSRQPGPQTSHTPPQNVYGYHQPLYAGAPHTPIPQAWGPQTPYYHPAYAAPPPPTAYPPAVHSIPYQQPLESSTPPVPQRPSSHGKLDPEKDPELANLLMSWYWCGYYSGRYEATQEVTKGVTHNGGGT